MDSVYMWPHPPHGKGIYVPKYLSLLPGQKQNFVVSLEGITGDGHYRVYYKIDEQYRAFVFGDFSEGNSVQSEAVINFKPNTTIVNSKF